MYVCQLTFTCLDDIDLNTAQSCISALLDAYRYNGQIIGREFPITLTNDKFLVTFVCPEKDSLAVKYNNEEVNMKLQSLDVFDLSQPEFELMGLECQSDFSDICQQPKALILYSTFVQSCSPVRCFEHFSPVPLYKLPEQVRFDLLKWQETHGACDQIQMNELSQAETAVVEQISDPKSQLMVQGKSIAEKIQRQIGFPVYRYIYRVGGESLEQEQSRQCPSCGGDWKLESPMFELFDFKCDNCLLVSNISWDWQ